MKNQVIHPWMVVDIYSKEDYLRSYSEDCSKLKKQLMDVKTLIEFAATEFPTMVSEARKKCDDYIKKLRTSLKATDEFLRKQEQQVQFANQILAYNALAQSSLREREDSDCIDSNTITFQLKLKFLESKGISHLSWEKVYKPSDRLLVLTSPDSKLILKVGIAMVNSKLSWAIKELTYMAKMHTLIYDYFRNLLSWIYQKYQHSDPEVYVLKYLSQSMSNIHAILLYLTLKNKKKDPIDQKHVVELEASKKHKNIKIQLKFLLIEVQEHASIQIVVNGEEIALLNVLKDKVFGHFYVKNANKNIELCCEFRTESLQESTLIKIAYDLAEYSHILKRFTAKYKIQVNDPLSLVVVTSNMVWLNTQHAHENYLYPNHFTNEVKDYISSRGVYMVCDWKSACQIDSNLNIDSKHTIKGFINNLLAKNISLTDIFAHLNFEKLIMQYNDCFQFKLNTVDCTQNNQFVYQFRQPFLFKVPKANRSRVFDQHELNLREKEDNFIIKVKISEEFKNVKFYANRPKSPEKEIPMTFLKEYKGVMQNGVIVNKEQLCKCISYLCTHYMVERIYHHRIQESERKLISYSFS